MKCVDSPSHIYDDNYKQVVTIRPFQAECGNFGEKNLLLAQIIPAISLFNKIGYSPQSTPRVPF